MAGRLVDGREPHRESAVVFDSAATASKWRPLQAIRSEAQFKSKVRLRLLCVCLAALLPSSAATAETISGALALAYSSNPDLDQQRAGTRADDELVSEANAAFRPQVQGSALLGPERTEGDIPTPTSPISLTHTAFPRSAGLVVTQNVFNGNRSVNGVRQADSQVLSSREQLRNTEIGTLLNGATAYMNVLRDTAILELNRNNISVLEEQLRQTRERYSVGQVTETDVSQSGTALANARSGYSGAKANLEASIANYELVIGALPRELTAARPVDALLPPTLPEAIEAAMAEHPLIQSALHTVDASQLQVQLNEGDLYPTLNVVGTVMNSQDYLNVPSAHQFAGTVMGQLNVPLYTGGQTFAAVRRAKELLTQARLRADLQRKTVRAAVITNWGIAQSARETVRSAQTAVKSSELSLIGVRQEAKVGQRTTFDVLQAQQIVLQARVTLVSAQRDRVVASYAVLGSVGRLSAVNLGLHVIPYDPTIHYAQVKDKWVGLRTPDGQ